ncbi:MAG: histidine phosphatase family protein, partial [Alphaproteobacteria bacterium]
VFYSPLERARESQELITHACIMGHVQTDVVQEDPLLCEQDFGALRAMSRHELMATSPEYAAYRKLTGRASKYYVAPPSGESGVATERAAVVFLQELREMLTQAALRHQTPAAILLVGHSVSNRLLAKRVLGQTVAWYMAQPSPPHGGVWLLEKGFNQGLIYTPRQHRSYTTGTGHDA